MCTRGNLSGFIYGNAVISVFVFDTIPHTIKMMVFSAYLVGLRCTFVPILILSGYSGQFVLRF